MMDAKHANGEAGSTRPPLNRILNPDHPLVSLTAKVDWAHLRQEVESYLRECHIGPFADGRLIIGLLYLKAESKLSEKDLLALWVENSYWQWFCGSESLNHQAPIDPPTLSRWSSAMGTNRLTDLFKKIKSAAAAS